MTSNNENDWTVMIYMSGDNNLSEECVWSIKEMYRVGVPEAVDVVVRYDSRVGGIYDFHIGEAGGEEPVRIKPEWQSPKQAPPDKIRRDDRDGQLRGYAKETGEDDLMASAEALRDYITGCGKDHKAGHYMVVLSGHAGGIAEQFLMKDENPVRYLSIPRLRWALEQAREKLSEGDKKAKIDILGFDACSMSMAEVGYEMRGVARFMVGAEGFELNTGWPYHRILEDLISGSSEMDPARFAVNIVKRYIGYYSDYGFAGISADLSACDLSQGRHLAAAVKELAILMTEGLKDEDVRDQIIVAHWRAQSYKLEEFTDLWDFCDQLGRRCKDPRISEACEKVKAVITDKYVLKSCYYGGEYQHSHGLSVYFPWVEDREALHRYKKLSFSRHAKWGAFIQAYVTATRREARPGIGEAEPTAGSDKGGKFIVDGNKFIVDGNKFIVDGNKFIVDGNKGELVRGGLMKNVPAEFYKQECT